MTEILITVSPEDVNDKLYGDMRHFYMNINEDHPPLKEFNYQNIYNKIIQDKIWLIFSNNNTVEV